MELDKLPLYWLIAGIMLSLLEIIVPGFVLIWFGISAIITSFVAFLFPSFSVQLIVFLVLSTILVTTAQYISKKYFNRNQNNVGADKWLAKKGVVIEDIKPFSKGIVEVDGEQWNAASKESLKKGDIILVEKVEGTHMIVKKFNS